MLEFIDSDADVVAARVGKVITTAELDQVLTRIEAAIERNDKTNIYFEIVEFDGLELKSLPSYFTRATPILSKLPRFGRVAVVADQTWVRVAAKVESALMPFISYRTFTSADRDEALEWVVGQKEA